MMSALSSVHDMSAGVLFNVNLNIVAAKGINSGEHFGLAAIFRGELSSSDAYTLIEINGKPMAWTHPAFDTVNPKWDENFYFQNVPKDSTFKLNLLDTDIYGDDELGEAQFDTRIIFCDKRTALELPITHNDRKAGIISIKVTCHQLNDTDIDAVIEEVGPVRYSVHSSHSVGLLNMLTSDDENLKSLAYIVQLHNIPCIMPVDNEWNKKYKKAQHIFSPDHPEGIVFRNLVKTQHAMVYEHERDSTKYGFLKTPADFFALIHNGLRDDRPVLFTYVITSKGWFFSETGAGFFKDMQSKHMVHSNAADSVKYAGEFRVEISKNGLHKLVLDNNSGTYTPRKDGLPQLKKLIENNFPGIRCETLDSKDEKSISRRKEILDTWE
ncbi:C2 domain [Plasmopara halstedii]|uniref:C2 domain n=1 Tax=Plasmopara halstedii TaxID=4781 RepID=A0A0P1B3Y1_PLAHL|nr:C2 domain [Plasmopara halstedii]CEG49485.1 C2 domain [Plasmopara halstedii]|eukprot:XP_024585854.1 C2 domain [Plasmopara halstedii]